MNAPLGHNSSVTAVFDPDAIAHALLDAGYEWADRLAAADALEEASKGVLGLCLLDYDGKVDERQARARNDQRYTAHVAAMVEAKRHANRARVKYDVMRVKSELLRTKAANLRVEMGLR